MNDFIEFAGKLVLVFVSAFAVCWLSACAAMEDHTKEDSKMWTQEEREARAKRYSESADTGRRYSIANRTAMMFASLAVVVFFIAYAVWTNR